jgi:hypothetical protein
MNPIPINLAVEDLLSEAVARRLLHHAQKNFAIGTVFNRGGFGYLRRTAEGWNAQAKSVPFFLLTDLDTAPCPSDLLGQWLPNGIHPNMLARVAVREVEAWLLADSEAVASFLGLAQQTMPANPDGLNDPKAELVRLAARSRKSGIKQRLIPKPNSTAKQGRDYNACLTEFVTGTWRPEVAANLSPSLERCLHRLKQFQPQWRS